MYVHEPSDLAYVAHPRTASRSTAWALRWQTGFRRVGGHHGPPGSWERWTTFATVRDPVDALASWTFKADRLEPTPEGVRRWAMQEGADYVERDGDQMRLFPTAGRADHLLRYERLESDLNDLLARYGFGPVDLPEIGVSEARERRSAREVLPESTVRWAREAFAGEIESLGYDTARRAA